MKAIRTARFSMTMAEQLGVLSFLIAGLLVLWDIRLSIIPLSGFLLLCAVAPFLPRFGFYLPITSRGSSSQKAVALTFDDGPDPLLTPRLLALLQQHQVKATFFVTGQKAAEHPEIMQAILLHGHSVGNHSYSHNNLVMFKSCKSIIMEIASTQEVLSSFGVLALAFRPPVGVTGPRLGPALLKSGKYIVNYSCRAFDGGNRWISNLSKKILNRIRPGDIVLLHDVSPPKSLLCTHWLNEIELIISGIKEKGLTILPLAEIIGRPVMIMKDDGVKK